jgi:RNA polymerase sigma-70 factor (ECF subfamily)
MDKRLHQGEIDAPLPAPAPRAPSPSSGAQGSLADFHAGSREAFGAIYRDHFATVDRAVGRIIGGADKETVVHEVFLRIMTKRELRLAFQGGSMHAWLAAVARNHAIDYARHQRLEQPSGDEADPPDVSADPADVERRAEARILVERFRRDHLPTKWAPVFELRFLRHIGQEQAARQLGIGRTTLAYREHCIKRLLRRFILKLERA